MTERANHLHIFFGISVALHALFFWMYLFPFLWSLNLPSIRPAIEIVEIPRAARKAPPPLVRPPASPQTPPRAEAPTRPEVEKAPEPVPPSADQFRDVVEIPKPAVEQAPRDTRIRSRYNQRVPRPARVRDRPIDNRGAISEREDADPLAKPGLEASERRSAEAKRAQEAQKPQPLSVPGGGPAGEGREAAARAGAPEDLGPPRPVSKDAIFRKREGEEGGGAAGKAGSRGRGEGLKGLLPTEERLAQLRAGPGGGRSNPYNPDLVPTDAKLSMDTLRMENVGYFLAVKNRLGLNWDPARLIRAARDDYEQTLRNFGVTNPLAMGARDALATAGARTGQGTTIIKFTIAKGGGLAGEPMITRSSGSAFLDEEALRSVRLGAPFPPVPDRLAENSLTLDWSFIFRFR